MDRIGCQSGQSSRGCERRQRSDQGEGITVVDMASSPCVWWTAKASAARIRAIARAVIGTRSLGGAGGKSRPVVSAAGRGARQGAKPRHHSTQPGFTPELFSWSFLARLPQTGVLS